MDMMDNLQKQAAHIAEEKFSERIRQQQQAQRTFRDDTVSDKRHLSRSAASFVLLAIIFVIIVSVIVLYQFFH